jgi:deoxyribodipyrimidine photo-lyase
MHTPKATRQDGQALLSAFIPSMGLNYERSRNFDLGPGQHGNVSQLSPYVRRRLVLEWELIHGALNAYGLRVSERFIQEVFWRGYFKGWLELRPTVWSQYRHGLAEDLSALETNSALRARVDAAEGGRTGLEYFDAWVNELITTGYLHNHARMWFASIWIFTLGLSWRIGADFFYRYLLDGDAASNTLSWRWVAGLHTRGKAYTAEGWNIQKFTAGRFNPGSGELSKDIEPLDYTEPLGLPEIQRLRDPLKPDVKLPSLLLLTDEDCCVEDYELTAFSWVAVASLASSQARSPREVSASVIEFERGALADAAKRNKFTPVDFEATSSDDSVRGLIDFIIQSGAKQVVTAYLTQGPTRDLLEAHRSVLQVHGIRLSEWRRDWDTQIWPHASAGFFRIKQKIPDFLRQLKASKR